MAGYKQTVLDKSPKAFWTFDEDTQSTVDATGEVFDEIGNANPMTVNGIKYTMQKASLVSLEIADQYSMEFASGGDVDDDWSDYNTYLSAPHAVAFDVSNEFTLEALFNVSPPGTAREIGGISYRESIHYPLMRKWPLFELYFRDTYGGSEYIRINLFNNDWSGTYYFDGSTPRNVSLEVNDRTFHVVATYKYAATGPGEWTEYLVIFVNGWKGVDASRVVTTEPDLTDTNVFTIGGTGGNNHESDFATAPWRIDQVAFYDQFFIDEEYVHHYKKIFTYTNMVIDSRPNHYWPLDDTTSVIQDHADTYNTTQIDGTYYGDIIQSEPGPDRLNTPSCTKFTNDALGYCQQYSSGSAQEIIHIDEDYSIEMWFRSAAATRSILFSSHRDVPYFNGTYLWLNSENNATSVGKIQYGENIDNYITSSTDTFNDDAWHYVVAQRDGSTVRLYVDGTLEATGSWGPLSGGDPSYAHIMGAHPGKINTLGWACNVAYYNYAIQETDISARWGHTTRYRLSGYTLYQGAPIAATVRFYDTISGELLEEQLTDAITGEYNYYPMDDGYVDIMAKIPDNQSARYRAHGPIKPAEYDDSAYA